MDNTTQNTQIPPIQNSQPVMNSPKQGGQGAVIGSVIIIILIALGAVFVIKNTKTTNPETQNDASMTEEDQSPVVDTNVYVESQSSLSGSDELSDIGTEIDSTDVSSVDYGVDEEFK